MALKISGVTVVDDSRALQNVTGLKTVGGQSILGTGDITAGGGFTSVSSISTSLNPAVAGVFYIFTASLTLTLPASPTAGQYIGVQNRSGTTTCVIARNGNNIMGTAEDMTVDVINAGFTLYYIDSTQGWVIL